MPEAPMPPPPPGFAPGGYAPPGAIPVDDYHAQPAAMPVYDDPITGAPAPYPDYHDDDYDDNYGKPKKNKKNKLNAGLVEVEFKGYLLERAEPLLGQKSSWARIGKRPLPFDDAKLQAITRKHRERTRTGPACDFRELTSNQQGIVNRLIAEHKIKEKNANADWILYDIQKDGKWHWRSLDIKKIQVILKRQDKNATKPGDKTTGNATSSYTFGEIIDLADPLPKAKDKKDKPKKNQRAEEAYDDPLIVDNDPLGPGFDNDYAPRDNRQQAYEPPPPPPVVQHGGGYQDPLHQYTPPGAIPIPPQQQYQPPYQPRPDENPFTPYAPYNAPGQYDQPLPHHPTPRGFDRSPSPRRQRSRSARRRHSPSPRPRRSSSARRIRRLENENKDLKGDIESLRDKVENWRDLGSSSSEGRYENDSVFSPPPSGGSFTPPSTPPHSEAFGPRGSLHHSKERRGNPRYRDERRYRDGRAEIQPAYTAQPRRRDSGLYSPDREHFPRYRAEPRYDQPRSPRLYRAQTYDDYPTSRVAEPRYLPPAPAPLQRRLTDYPEAYQQADFDDQYRRRSRRQIVYDPVADAYERGRREAMYDEVRPAARRRSVYAQGDGYYR